MKKYLRSFPVHNLLAIVFLAILVFSIGLIASNVSEVRDPRPKAATSAQTPDLIDDTSSSGSCTLDAPWANMSNAKTDNGAYATSIYTGGSALDSKCLRAKGFGFSIPSGSTINSIKIEIERKAQGNQVNDSRVLIRKPNGTTTTNLCDCSNSIIPSTDSILTVSTTNQGLSVDDINNVGFGVLYNVYHVGPNTVYLDFIRITIDYTAPSIPTASISADDTSISYNTSTTIRWSSTDATSCSASGDWWGSKVTSGSQSTGNLASGKTYSISCTGAGGTSTTKSVTVNVGSKPPDPDPDPDPDSDPPPDGGGETSMEPIPGGGLPSLPPPPPRIPGVAAPIIPDIVNILKINLSVPYLLGNIKSPLIVGGYVQDLELKPGVSAYEVDVRGAKFPLGKDLTVEIGGNKTLIKKLKLKTKVPKQPVKFGTLYLGDTNRDNKINDEDFSLLLDYLNNRESEGDINFDGVSNSFDWAILIANFGRIGNR